MSGQLKPVVIQRRYAAPADLLWSLWTTAEGFGTWWGPVGFRADVRRMEARAGGIVHYTMVADSPEMIAAMKAAGETGLTECRGSFTVFQPVERLELTQRIDFLPGVPAYDSRIGVELVPDGDGVRMTVTLSAMHDAPTTRMQEGGFLSQLGKLDRRFGWSA